MMLKDFNLKPKTDPAYLLNIRDGIYAADLLIAAVGWLDFFTWLSNKKAGKQEISRHFDITERPLDVMLTLFCAMGLLAKEADRYFLTRFAKEYLVKDSPWELCSYFSSLRERPICKELLEVLRSGKPTNWGSKADEGDWHTAMEREDFVKEFTAAMDSRGVYFAPILAQRLKMVEYGSILDIAGGSGVYTCALIAANPGLRGMVLEKRPVYIATQHLINSRKMSEKVSVKECDVFKEPFPRDFDVHLYSHVLHDWDEDSVNFLLRKSYEALSPGGMIAIFDAHINKDKTGPLEVAEYSVLLMSSTLGKCYSVGEIGDALKMAGFVEKDYTFVAANRSLITAKKPK